jgi:hypothetical protein
MLKIGDKREVEKLRRAADGVTPFEPSPLFERLIVMRARTPQSFASMSPATVLALGYYEAAKRKAAMMNDG